MSIGIFDTSGNNFGGLSHARPPPLNLTLDRAANKSRAILTISQHGGDFGQHLIRHSDRDLWPDRWAATLPILNFFHGF